MSPKHLGANMYQLVDTECLQDKWDPSLKITAPEVVREEDLGTIDGARHLRYQGAEFTVGVEANNINEAVKRCRPEG